jgi:catechol 2,3-dioxygenase-like lactoylglutathione lyase family enzyme
MIDPASALLRIARPTADMDAAIRFWTDGLDMTLQGRQPSEQGTLQELAFLGWPHAAWHLELVRDSEAAPTPGDEDLLVLYLEGAIDEALLARVERAGGRRVSARNPYWDEHGVTIADPDGYQLVLSTRSWGR